MLPSGFCGQGPPGKTVFFLGRPTTQPGTHVGQLQSNTGKRWFLGLECEGGQSYLYPHQHGLALPSFPIATSPTLACLHSSPEGVICDR